jgi:DNA-binding NtrC family response regulator
LLADLAGVSPTQERRETWPAERTAMRAGEPRSLEAVRTSAERALILDVLATTQGRRTDAARILGISRKTLWKKLKQLGIAPGDVTDR